MYHDLPHDARFWSFLFALDKDLAEKARSKAVPAADTCTAPTIHGSHAALPSSFPSHSLRLSFCCDRDGCRKRVTPPSVRFLGPKVYLGVIVILISAMRQGPTPRRVRELSTRFGADRRTIARWQVFWREHFPQTPFWKIARAGWCRSSRSSPALLAPGRLPATTAAGVDAPASLSLTDHDPRRPANRGLAMIASGPQKMLVDHFFRRCIEVSQFLHLIREEM